MGSGKFILFCVFFRLQTLSSNEAAEVEGDLAEDGFDNNFDFFSYDLTNSIDMERLIMDEE